MIIDLTDQRRSRRPAMTLLQLLTEAEVELHCLSADADRGLFVDSQTVDQAIGPILQAVRAARRYATETAQRRPG